MTFQPETHAFIFTLLNLFLLAGTLELLSQHITLWRLEVHQDILVQERSNLSAGAGDREYLTNFNCFNELTAEEIRRKEREKKERKKDCFNLHHTWVTWHECLGLPVSCGGKS